VRRKKKRALPPCAPRKKRARNPLAEPFCDRAERYCGSSGVAVVEQSSATPLLLLLGLAAVLALSTKAKREDDQLLVKRLPASTRAPTAAVQEQLNFGR
jgi:hypothetical protein